MYFRSLFDKSKPIKKRVSKPKPKTVKNQPFVSLTQSGTGWNVNLRTKDGRFIVNRDHKTLKTARPYAKALAKKHDAEYLDVY